MYEVVENVTWGEALLVVGALVAVGFVTSWLATDVLRMTRGPYIAVLAAVTGAAVVTVAWATDVSVGRLVGHHWQSGILGGVISGLVVGAGIRRMPATLHRSGHELHGAEAWEGVVYGASEGVLLSALPLFVVWQAATDAGWGTVAAWAVSLAASAALIAFHHFGYWDFRNRTVLPVVAGCLVLSIAFLATGSMVAPVLGHVFMHVAGITKGVELPPHDHLAAIHGADTGHPARS